MPAYRCTNCAHDWPQHDDYDRCPTCLEPTNAFGNIKAMPVAEARSLKNHADFERFYEEREQSRLKSAAVS